MNKKLQALGAALLLISAGAAQAQSKVNLYGLIDMSVGGSKAPGSSSQIVNADSGKMSTSFIGFSGTEDIGSGLSAFFTLESFIRVDIGNNGRFNGDAFWARNAFVGLTSKELGTVRAGRITTPLFVQTLLFNAFGDSFGYSPVIRQYFSAGPAVATGALTGDSGWSDSVQYLSPKFGGFSWGAIVAAGEGAGGRNFGANASYYNGPFGVSFSFQNVKKDSSSTAALNDTKAWQFAASYDAGAVKLFGQYGKVDNDTINRDYKIASIGAAIPAGEGKILLQYSGLSASVGADRKTFSAGYDYFLSKRTDLYAVFMKDKLEGLSAGTSYSVGLRHRF